MAGLVSGNKLAALSTDANGNTVLVWPDGSASFNDAGFRGASPSATAAVNTAAIQAAITAGGQVTITTPGTYLINDTLVYGSNTHLKLAPGVVIKMAPSINKTLLVSDALARYTAGGVTVTPTLGTAGDVTVVSLAYASAHGRSVGDAIYTWGVTPWVYCGVFRVESVTNATTLTIRLPYTPSIAPTGTMKAIVATQNTTIEGGLWDYDFSNNGSATALNVHGIALYFAENCHIKSGTRVTNCNKYAFVSAGTLNCTIDANSPYNQSDGVKMYGPARNTHVLGVTGTFGDDVCSLQAYENLSQYYAYVATAGGELYNVSAKNINATTSPTASVATLYLTDGIMSEHIEFDGIYGYGTYAGVRIEGLTQATSRAGSVKISNLGGQGYTNRALLVKLCTVRSITIDKWKLNPDAAGTINSLLFQTTSTVDQVVISNPDVSGMDTGSGYAWASSGSAPAILVNGTIKHLIADMGLMNSAQIYQGIFLSLASCTVNKATISNGVFNGAVSIVYVSGTLGATPNIEFNCNYIKGPYRLVGADSSCNIMLSGNVIDAAQHGVVRTTGAVTVNITSNGTNQFIGTTVNATTGIYTIASGTPVVSVKGWDIPAVLNATGMTKTNGSYCYNTATAAGTIVQNRLVTCNGTNWVQVDDTTKTY